MKVCIIGDGLVSLTLAKTLVNQGIFVDILTNKKSYKVNKYRTIGISKENIDFFNKNILNIKKLLWKIKKIEIYSQNLKNKKLLDFENKNDQLFSIIKNYELFDNLILSLKKNKFFKFKKIKKINEISLRNEYSLVVNCDANSSLAKKRFNKRLNKNYNSVAYTTYIDHKKLPNNIATQIFTKNGPLAFLPVSNIKTSVVYSVRGGKDIDIRKLIEKHNNKYLNIKINEITNFELKSSNLRSYHFKNILAFGEMLHKLHPLAGQGFNMSIRDVKELLNLIKSRTNLGLELDSSICLNNKKKTRHKNYIFSQGIDFIYEFFNLESKIDNPILGNSVSVLGKNKYVNKLFTRFADKGLVI